MKVETSQCILPDKAGPSFPARPDENRNGIVAVQHELDLPRSLCGGVILLGNFDGFHLGHQSLLAAAQRIAHRHGAPLGAMSSEPHPRSFFAPGSRRYRLTGFSTKREIFRHFGLDYVYAPRFDAPMAATAPEDFVTGVLAEGLGVSHVVVGHDFRFGKRRRGCAGMLQRMGASAGFGVTQVSARMANERPYSSTLARELLGAGDVRGVSSVLGYDWFFDADVADSNVGLIRLDVPDQLAIPAEGVYTVAVSGPDGGHCRVNKLYVQGDMLFLAASGHCPGNMHLPGRVRVRLIDRI